MLLLLDDNEDILQLFKEPLALACGQPVETLLHEGSSAAELAQQVLLIKPQWVLLDGNLATGVQGPELVPPLSDAGIKVIGFSSAQWMGEEFLHAGAKGFVQKDTSRVSHVVQDVAKIVSSS